MSHLSSLTSMRELSLEQTWAAIACIFSSVHQSYRWSVVCDMRWRWKWEGSSADRWLSREGNAASGHKRCPWTETSLWGRQGGDNCGFYPKGWLKRNSATRFWKNRSLCAIGHITQKKRLSLISPNFQRAFSRKIGQKGGFLAVGVWLEGEGHWAARGWDWGGCS